MNFSARQIWGHAIRHGDEAIGVLRDLLFNNQDWSIRYLVVETGAWPAPQRVLLEPRHISNLDLKSKTLTTTLVRSQVEDCPLERSHPCASQQFATQIAGSASPQPHWAADPPVATVIENDPCLESAQEIIGYTVCGEAAHGARVTDLQMWTPTDCFRPVVKAVCMRSLWGWGIQDSIPVATVVQIDFRQRQLLVRISPASVV